MLSTLYQYQIIRNRKRDIIQQFDPSSPISSHHYKIISLAIQFVYHYTHRHTSSVLLAPQHASSSVLLLDVFPLIISITIIKHTRHTRYISRYSLRECVLFFACTLLSGGLMLVSLSCVGLVLSWCSSLTDQGHALRQTHNLYWSPASA